MLGRDLPTTGGDTHSLVGRGGANSDAGTDTIVLCILIPSLCSRQSRIQDVRIL
jgi:hypothetical protein